MTMDLSVNPFIRVDEITATPAAMVRALHIAMRICYAAAFTALNSQGAVARVAIYDDACNKDMPKLLSTHTPL